MQIYCLSWSGGRLNDPIRNLLFDTAQEMMDEGDKGRTIKTSTGEGEVTTDNEQAVLGGFCGTVFQAQLDTEWGSFEVTYVVRPTRNLKALEMNWGRL